jgi:hypothetical protein
MYILNKMDNKEIEKKYWDKTVKYINFIKFIPFVKMVAVCNNLAFGKVTETSDIDLFIVTKRKRLFFVRSLITFIFSLLRVRRYGNKIKGRFCLSFFVDEDHMNLEPISLKRDIYLAYWIKNIVPIILNENFDQNFINSNRWIRKYFEENEDFNLGKVFVLNKKSKLEKYLGYMFDGEIGDFIEKVLSKWQINRANKKIEKLKNDDFGNIVTSYMLKFHDIDRRKEYRDKWMQKYDENIKLTKERFLSL